MKELLRQSFHAINGVLFFALILITPPIFFQSLMICLTIAFIYLKILVYKGYKVPIAQDYFKIIGRKKEDGEGSFYFILGALIVSLFFEPLVAGVAVLVLGMSDAASTIIGYYFGKVKIYKKKTLEGTSAFFLTTFLIISYFFNPIAGLISGIILAVIELYSGFNDNIVIPPACALIIVMTNLIIG